MAASPDLLALHHRLLAGDRMAFEQLMRCVFGPLKNALPCRDADVRHDAAVDALVDYFNHPQKFDPAKRSLMGYLRMAAGANLKNGLRAKQRRRRHEAAAGRLAEKSVELPPPPGNNLETAEAVQEADAAHGRLLAALDPADRPVAELLREGVRETSAYAAAMGITGLPAAEQKVLVKRAKDRVKAAKKRLKLR